jgi:hypothetical protein
VSCPARSQINGQRLRLGQLSVLFEHFHKPQACASSVWNPQSLYFVISGRKRRMRAMPLLMWLPLIIFSGMMSMDFSLRPPSDVEMRGSLRRHPEAEMP